MDYLIKQMLTIISPINSDFLNATYCEKYSVIIHKWSGYINASDICIQYKINYFKFTNLPIYFSICEYIKQNLRLKPTQFMPHGIDRTQGIYIHQLLLPYLILETGDTDVLKISNPLNIGYESDNDVKLLRRKNVKPKKQNKILDFCLTLKKTINEIETLLVEDTKEYVNCDNSINTDDTFCCDSISTIDNEPNDIIYSNIISNLKKYKKYKKYTK